MEKEIKKSEGMTLEYLAPYLPYKLQLKKYFGDVTNPVLIGIEGGRYIQSEYYYEDEQDKNKHYKRPILKFDIKSCVPILRPLSDFTKEISINGLSFKPASYLIRNGLAPSGIDVSDDGDYFFIGRHEKSTSYEGYDVLELNYVIIQKLLEWHFDIFGLIEKKLAIDINMV